MNDPYAWLADSLNTIKRANWYRQVKALQSLPGAVVTVEGHDLINFASNDYLGLAGDARLITAAVEATQKWGTGSSGSRLLSGHRDLHQQLEKAIASLKGTEDAIVFTSGYLANLGTIVSLVGKRDLILEDEYNHSSLKNGAKLSGSSVRSYKHTNITHLEAQLSQYRSQYRRCLILSDTIFSMDGDLCPLPQLLSLGKKYDAMVMVDEAHATGVMGERGAGCVEYWGCRGEELVQMGTLSKALGSLGGYVAGSAVLIDFLRNRAPTWIYTTALSPADTASAIIAIDIIQHESCRRQQLWRNISLLKQQLLALNLPLFPTDSPIICLALNSPSQALEIADKLKEEGIFAPAIRPPTVPTSRLRFSVMATHKESHILQLIEALKKVI